MSAKNIFILSILFCFTAVSYASDYHSPRTAALGGAGHGSPLLTDAIYLNPAMASFLPAYSVSTSYNAYDGKNNSEPRGRVYHFSIQDGRNELFQAGMGYTRRADGAFLNIGASKAISQKYGVGLGSKYAFRSANKKSANDGTLSFLANPLPWFQGSLIVDNLLQTANGKNWNLYREYILGMKFSIMNILMIYFDPHLVPSKVGNSFGYEVGLELPLFQDLYLRAGKSQQSLQPHVATYGRGYGMGLGWVFPRFSLDAALYRSVEPILTNNKEISMTISY
jgi:hypothetical protein